MKTHLIALHVTRFFSVILATVAIAFLIDAAREERPGFVIYEAIIFTINVVLVVCLTLCIRKIEKLSSKNFPPSS
jgi:hypothetical protein